MLGPCLSEFYADARPGTCPVCERLFTPKQKTQRICGAFECYRERLRAIEADKRLRKRGGRPAQERLAGWDSETLNRRILALSTSGLTAREISVELGISVANVHQRMSRMKRGFYEARAA